jgi:N-acetylglucosamine-6-phosphate deacetylase
MNEFADGLRGKGYEYFLPTTVTASVEAVLSAADKLDHPMAPGFHLEGPFISQTYPGAQPKEFILDPPASPSLWDRVFDHPKLRLITMAPESPGGLDLIRRLHARGVLINFGHTNATFAQLAEAVVAGLNGATHTYNAMRPLHHREAGAVGFALSTDSVDCELIYDRVHVSPQAAALLVKCKPKEHLVAISDATMAAGLPVGTELTMWNHAVVVGPGDVRLAENGALAGSTITLADAFKNISEDFGIETAIRSCSLNARRRLGLSQPPKVWLEVSPEFTVIDSFQLR